MPFSFINTRTTTGVCQTLKSAGTYQSRSLLLGNKITCCLPSLSHTAETSLKARSFYCELSNWFTTFTKFNHRKTNTNRRGVWKLYNRKHQPKEQVEAKAKQQVAKEWLKRLVVLPLFQYWILYPALSLSLIPLSLKVNYIQVAACWGYLCSHSINT